VFEGATAVVDPLTTTFEFVEEDVSALFCIFIFPLIRSDEAAFICFKFILEVAVDMMFFNHSRISGDGNPPQGAGCAGDKQ